ncbi:MAG: FkbM family methyltransferase [Polyangiaceae bacterium]
MQGDPLTRLRTVVQVLGAGSAAAYLALKVGNRLGVAGGPVATMHSRHAQFPLFCRAGTSDVDVFTQILVNREYRCLDHVEEASLVIDCGANVGYSAAYFLTRFPRAFVVAVEPDPGNFALLVRNLAPYEGRARAMHTGVWSHATGLAIAEDKSGDGREWAVTVREARAGERPAMTATDVASLLAASGHPRISILKVDVEGAERVIFAGRPGPWLDVVDNLVIELHGAECEAVFHRAIADRGFEVSRCDELTVCRRRPS